MFLKDKKYFSIFTATTGASFLLLLTLTITFPYSSFTFFNYFLKNNITVAISTIVTMVLFSTFLGIITSYTIKHFKKNIEKRLIPFFIITGIFFIISYLLLLANNSFSLFSYLEMNGFLFTTVNLLLLAPVLPLTSILLLNIYTMIKNPQGISGAGGLSAGLFSLGCPSCGALLLSLIGVTAGLAIFPLGGLELRILSLVLLIYATHKLDTKTCKPSKIKINSMFSSRIENIMLTAIIISAGLIFFNQLQITEISSTIGIGSITRTNTLMSNGDLSNVDISKITSTAMSLEAVFPELKNAETQEDVVNIMMPSGTPDYSEALGGITFDDPVSSLNYLAKWYYTYNDEIKNNYPDIWQRYLNLAAAPRGISCEYCCGVGPQGVSEDGQSKCGCQHNPALLVITLGLMKNTNYSDAEILREIMYWKTLFFPKNMISLGVQVAGQDASELNLPGMVGGC